jgi:uncharacterized membrane protein (DUF106 family)
MNGTFKTVSDTICFTRAINTAAAGPGGGPPGKTEIMLIVLIAIAVIFSLLTELFYGYLADRHQLGWVRPEVNEHAAIMRQLSHMRQPV